MLTSTFSQANLGKMAIRAVLYPLGLCVLYNCRSPCTPCLPHEWKDGKRERSPVFQIRPSLLQTQPWGRWGKRDDQDCPAIDPSPSIGNEKITRIQNIQCIRTIKLYLVDFTCHAPIPSPEIILFKVQKTVLFCCPENFKVFYEFQEICKYFS